jgi:hydroxylaminobenzene mutase
VGLAWGELRLAPGAGKAAYWLLLYGTFANWAATLLSGLWGTSRLTPLAGAGHVGSKLQEDVVQALLVSLSLAMVVSVGLLAWGAFARLREER